MKNMPIYVVNLSFLYANKINFRKSFCFWQQRDIDAME